VSRTLLRLGVTALSTATLSAVALVPSPAMASSMYFSKSSGTFASAKWLEVGALPGVAGNAHFGDMRVEDLGKGRARASGIVFDVQCEAGVEPYNPGGGHGGPPAEGPCQSVGERFIDGGTLTFTMDRKFSTARLTGNLAVQSHGTGSASTPKVDMTWTGTGDVFSERSSGTFTDEYGTSSYRYTFSGRNATIEAGSAIGAMVFDDEPGETSVARLGSYREVSRGRG
jgi:hypothetical protein